MEELKACPFCGGKPEISVKESYNPTKNATQTRVQCSNHWCLGRNNKWFTNKYDAIARWNIRIERKNNDGKHRDIICIR